MEARAGGFCADVHVRGGLEALETFTHKSFSALRLGDL